MNPILDRTRSVAEQPGDLRAGQALRHEQDAVQAVIVTHSSERWISCCKLKTDVASDIDSGLMATGEHFLIRCAITYDVVFRCGSTSQYWPLSSNPEPSSRRSTRLCRQPAEM